MFIRPKKTIAEILEARIKLKEIILFLFWLGILRGVVEVIWIFSVNHRLAQLPFFLRQWPWYLFESGPFLLANIVTAYLRWTMYGLVFYLGLKFFKINADFFKILKVFSVILGLYVLTGLLNFMHYFFKISMLKFYVTNQYWPAIGIGQIISSLLLIRFVYKLGRHLGLDIFSALLSAVSVLAADRFFYFFAAYFYLRLPIIKYLSYRMLFNLGNYLSSLFSILLAILFLWLGFRINGQRKVV